jgi:uncharacterized membrane protein
MMIPRANFGLFRRYRIERDQPVVKPEMNPVDWLLETIALTGLLFIAGYTIYNYPALPDTIATHFNASGQADELGGKDSFFFLPGVAVFTYILLTLANLIPYRFNYTVKITQGNALRQYTLATRMLRILKIVLILLFWYISYATVQVSKGATGLGMWFLPLILGIIFGTLIIYFITAYRNK